MMALNMKKGLGPRLSRRGPSVRDSGLLTAGLGMFIVLAAAGSDLPAAAARSEGSQQPLQHEVSVVLKLVHVYVTDKKGRPVEDLALDDFSATDDGRPVKLTEFERHVLLARSEQAEPPPPAGPQAVEKTPEATRKFFLFFDFAYNTPRGIAKAKRAALHFLETTVRPGDEVGILTYSMLKGVVVHEYLTKDHAKVREVVNAVGRKDVAGRAHEIEEQYWLQVQEPLPGDRGGGAGAVERNLEAQREESKRIAQTFIFKLTALAKALRYVPGQKHFLLFSTGVPSSIIYGSQAGNPSGPSASPASRARTKFDPGDRLLIGQNEQMYKEFGASGCAFYAFDTRESAKDASLFAYDDYTFQTGSRSVAATQGVFQDSTNIFRDERTTGKNSLERLTAVTGGRYFSNIARYEKNLGQVQELTGTFYVLGYYTGETSDGRYHEVKVEVRRKDCRVRAQAGYFNPKPFREFTDLEKRLHLYDLALNERSFSGLAVRFPMTALAYSAGQGMRVEMVARVPGDVTAKFTGERVEYVALVFDAKSDIRDVRRTETDPRPGRGQAVVFASGADLEPGDYTCRLVIRDLDSGTGAAGSARVFVRAKPAGALSLGTPLLLTDGAGCASIDAGAARSRGGVRWREAYPFDRTLYTPAAGEVSSLAARVLAVVPYSGSDDASDDVSFSAGLIEAATGRAVPAAAVPLGRNWTASSRSVTLEVPLAGLAPGRYILYVGAEDGRTKAKAHAQTALVIKAE